MNERVYPGETSDAILKDAPTGLVGTLTFELVASNDAVLIAESTASIEESAQIPGRYRREVTWPDTHDITVTAVWRNGAVVVTEDFDVTTAPAEGVVSPDHWLTTLELVRAHLQKNAIDTGQDDTIEQHIDSASQAIIDRYGVFRPAETAATKKFAWDGGHRLSLYPYFLRSASAVVIDTNETTTSTLSAAAGTNDYSLRPLSPDDGVYKWLRLPNHVVEVGLEREVSITGDWGFADGEVPSSVEQAARITVVEWMRRGVQAFGTGFVDQEDAGFAPAGLPVAAKRLLTRYDRWGQG